MPSPTSAPREGRASPSAKARQSPTNATVSPPTRVAVRRSPGISQCAPRATKNGAE